eukprot:gene818-21798_t
MTQEAAARGDLGAALVLYEARRTTALHHAARWRRAAGWEEQSDDAQRFAVEALRRMAAHAGCGMRSAGGATPLHIAARVGDR